MLLGAVVLLCGHHITTGRGFQEHSVVYKAHFFWKADFDSSCLPWERVRVLSHSQKDQTCFPRKSNMKVTSGQTGPAKGASWCQWSWLPAELTQFCRTQSQDILPQLCEGSPGSPRLPQTQGSPALSHPLQETTNCTVPGKAKLNCKIKSLWEGNGDFGQISKAGREGIIRKLGF